MISGIRNQRNFKTQLARLINKLPSKLKEQYDIEKVYTLEHSQMALRAARQMRYKVMAQASELRTMFIQEQAAAALVSDGNKEVILKRLLQAQERSDMY
jgi:hypothetical protein